MLAYIILWMTLRMCFTSDLLIAYLMVNNNKASLT